MTPKDCRHEHGAAVRNAADFAASLVVAVGKDIALNVRRGGGYLGGFVQGLVSSRNSVPNA
jgi:hypothetical protein